MELAIALLLTLAIAGSVLWVMPSPHEKKLDAFRKLAMAEGIRVRLLDTSMAARFIPWIKDHRGYVLYELSCKSGRALPVKGYRVVRLSDDDSLHELDRQEPLRQNLLASGMFEVLPASCESLVVSAGGVSIVWQEKGEIEGVRQLSDILRRCLEMDYTAFLTAT